MVRRMLVEMVARLGYTPVVAQLGDQEQLVDADVLLVEPAATLGITQAQAAWYAEPPVPIVCASVAAPPAAFAELGIAPAAVLAKPFTSAQLDAAILQVLARRRGCNGSGALDRAA
jgi:hypothetical protein